MLRRPILRRRAALSLAALAAARLARAGEEPVAALLGAFAAIRERRAAFAEEKELPELDRPLRSHGTLSWRAPDRLEKRTAAPIEEVLRIEGETLTLERPQQGVRQVLGLDQAPELRPLVEAIRATLAGDLPALRRHFALAFAGDPAEGWTLVLTPLSPRVLAAVQRVTLSGRGAAILGVESQQGGGFTRLRIEPAR
ncbi:LolA-related protein [Caldovatus aquaticus]|uniref:Outer membrane lipoprotein carrier protein LolA n=1 Tax=Caldovatus aquaticus TaxID=2865671 RepID=A0ABS7F4U7_9PROT|nr:LolA-related protein [Caldovatus aquaticus]MBW8270639.1 outer membrane lipoprotein carrier protein LolA [Caldovatus aquaticus]